MDLQSASFLTQVEASASSAESASGNPVVWGIVLIAVVAVAIVAAVAFFNRKNKGN